MGIAVLGPVAVDGTDERLGRRDRVVLTALAYRAGHDVGAEELADALWPDGPPASAPKIVQGCIVRLRKLLGSEAIATVPAGYRLTLPPDEIDVHRFEQQVARARELLALDDPERAAFILTEACELWRGRPLPDLEEWAAGRLEANRLEEVRRDAEELRLEAMLRSGRHREVLGQAQALVNDVPLRERRWWLLALAQYQGGRQADALRTLHQLRTVLQRELALDPGPDVVALEHAILNQDQTLMAEDAPPPATGVCPFQGLVPFDVDDAENFFGREEEVRECLHRLSRDRILVVVGPSGCGKSSLVRAGVAAHLRRGGARVTVVTPGRHPMDALHGLPSNGRRPHVLVVDQLEELLTVTATAAERNQFLDTVVERAASAQVVLALRADRLGDASSHPGLAALVERGLFVLVAMDADGLRAAIEAPTRQAGLLIEPGLVDLLIAEVENEPGALPLLSHALRETWLRREGRTLTVAAYRASGGIRGSVAQSAEAVYQQAPAVEQAALRALMLRLVAPGSEGEPVRTRVTRQVISDGQDDLVDRLVASRLVTSDADVVQVAHEALVRSWPRLREWLEEDIDGQRILHHLSDAAEAWAGLGRPDSELYRGVRLAKALEWRNRTEPSLTQTETDFLDASLRLSQQELRTAEERARAQSRTNRRLRALLGATLALLIVAAWLGTAATRSSTRAEEAAIAREADAVGARALITTDIAKSLLLAVAAARVSPSASTRADLAAALAQRSALVAGTQSPSPNVRYAHLAVSPDGTRLVVTGADGAMYLHDARSLELLDSYQSGRVQPGGKPENMPVAFSPDGASIAVAVSAPARPPVRLLSVRDDRLQPLAAQPGGWPSHAVRAPSIAFSADGRRLAVFTDQGNPGSFPVSKSPTALVWDTRQLGRPLQRIALDVDVDQKVLLSPNGGRLYLTDPLTAYDVATGRRLYRHQDLGSWVFADISQTGAQLAIQGGNDVFLARAADGSIQRRLAGTPPGYSTNVAFSPDGSRVALYKGVGAVYVWDVKSGELTHTFTTGDDFARGMAFSADGSTLYTAGADRQLLAWDLAGHRSFLRRLDIADAVDVPVLTWSSPDGSRVSYVHTTESGRQELLFLDVGTGQTSAIARVGSPEYFDFGWRADGKRVVALTRPRGLAVFDPRTGRSVAEGRVGGIIHELAYTADGRSVVVAAGRTIEVLDASTLERRTQPVRLDAQVMGITPSPDGASAMVALLPSLWNWHEQQPINLFALVDLSDGRVLQRGKLPLRNASWSEFSPRGDQVAIVGDGGQVLLWDPKAWRPVAPTADPNGPRLMWVSYNADGSRLLTAGGNEARLWDTRTGQELGVVTVPTGVSSGGFQPDGTLILADLEGGIHRWNPSLAHSIEFACQSAGRDLTTAEWDAAFPDLPYRTVCHG